MPSGPDVLGGEVECDAEAQADAGAQLPRRRRPWVLASLAVVLAVVVGGSTWLVVERRASDAHDGQRDAAPTPSATGPGGLTSKQAAQRQLAISELLEERGRAILGGDRAAFLRQIDPVAGRFKERQATVFDRLANVPLASWDYDYAGEGPKLRGYLASVLPKGAFVARVNLRYTFAVSDTPVESQQFLTLVPREGEWRFADDRDNVPGVQSGIFGRDIWEVGPVTVVHGRNSLVIGPGKASALRAYARQADRAVRDVDAVWKKGWSRRPVVIVPRTEADMADIVGTTPDVVGQFAAMTTGFQPEGPSFGDRIVINPAAWREYDVVDRRALIVHEMTHLATGTGTHASVPIWMSEGFAEYVANQAVHLQADEAAEELLGLVSEGEVPLPWCVNETQPPNDLACRGGAVRRTVAWAPPAAVAVGPRVARPRAGPCGGGSGHVAGHRAARLGWSGRPQQ